MISSNRFNEFHFKITSRNDFPTASGLASSASGLAAIALCLSEIFNCSECVSEMARLGSGSASRSIFGGLVEWISPDKGLISKVLSG